MFTKAFTLFRLFGFEVKLDLSWLILAVLVAWSLAEGLFPSYYQGLPASSYWWMGAAGSLGLLFSIVFHEMSHSLAARRFGLPIKGITLFMFGGVAEMEKEPESPGVEFWMAALGPLSSLALAGFFYLIYMQGARSGWPLAVLGVLDYMAFLNLALAGFNLVPAFPLDGGRVLRAALWRWKRDIRWATRITSRLGSAFGLALILLGVFAVIRGNFMGGMWWFLIGMFLRGAAKMAYRRLVITDELRGEKIRLFMNSNPVTVPPDATVEELVNKYMYRHHYKMFPVVRDGELVGCVTSREVKELPREEWSRRTVSELSDGCGDDRRVGPDEDAMEALSRMNRSGDSRLMVVEDGRLAGVVSLKDMMKFLSIKMDLEGPEAGEVG
jgi:Zn-dependent protease/predicted transcriptional regulator